MKRLLLQSMLLVLFTYHTKAQTTFPINGPADPKHFIYAFTNAKVHIDYKTLIDSAVLVIKDGLIVDAGKGVAIPKEAIVFDLKGKHIYPSFIEIFSDYGMPEIKKLPDSENPQFISNTKGAYGWNQAVKSETDAYRIFTVDAKKAEEFRKLGFGAVMSHNKDGIIRGSAAVVLTGDGKENQLILKDKAAAVYSFDKGSSTQDYPSSLMGAIALIRQSYYDAQWYKTGGYKQQVNISLDAINNLLALPSQIFDAGDKQNELRAASIAKEFNLKYIIKGSGDEYERINEIKDAVSGLIVPLNFPEAYDLSDPYESINLTLHQMKEWELKPTNPGVISANNIPFALTTSDLKNKSDLFKNLRKAIENGFNEEAALRSLTDYPAQFLGVADKLGSLKKGMVANFIITSRNFTDKDNTLFENWVNGKRFRYADTEGSDIRGNYTLSIPGVKPMRMKIGNEYLSPDAMIYEDTAATKATVAFTGQQLNIQFELKKADRKGVYRLTTNVNTISRDLSGSLLTPDGNWGNWVAKFDSAFVVPSKSDTTKKELNPNRPVLYPNVAFGFDTLPVVKTYLIKNTTVWTNEAEGIIKNTDVLIVNGKISSIAKDIKAADAVVVDGTNKHLTAGIIDEHSHIAVANSVNEGTKSSSAEVRIGDVIDPDDIQIYHQLAGGVTSSHLLHGSANPIGGQTQLIKLRWGLTAEKLKFENWPGYIKFALGENVKQSHWGDKQVVRFPQTRMGVEEVYNDYFTRAKEYSLQWNNFKNSKGGIAPRKDLELDALAEIIDSKRFITCHSYVQSEINMLMHVADSFGFKVNTFTHILEGYKVADKMKAHGLMGASTFSDWWAYKFEVYEAIPFNGAIMNQMGLTVAYNSDDAEMARRLNQEAAKAVKYGGVSEEEAWKFVTLNPAKMLRVDSRVGSIKSGKDADIVLWNDNPLSIYAKAEKTWIDGILYFDLDRDLKMRADIAKEKARLMQKMTDAKNRGESTQKPSMKALELKGCLEVETVIMK